MVASMPAPELQLIFAARSGPAKSRCAAVLTPAQRDALTEALLRDVLAAARLFRTWLVTPSPSLAAIAQAHGATTISEAPNGGLNAAFSLAMAHVTAQVADAALALLPSDLAYLSNADIAHAHDLLDARDVVFAPTQHGGTGAVFLRPGVDYSPAFGPDSFARHMQTAHARCLRTEVLDREGFARDIDTPEDLTALAATRPDSHAGAFAARVTAGAVRR